jgi:hypothetical protein
MFDEKKDLPPMDARDRDDRNPMVTGVFRDRDSAERGYAVLERHGYGRDRVSVLVSEEGRKRHFGDRDNDTELGNKALEGAGVGAMTGAGIGAAITAILAAGTALTIPGLGLVIAGPLAGALAGAGAGGVAGTLVGALVGAGIPEERAKLYQGELERGGIVLGVHPSSEQDAEEIEKAWKDLKAEHVHR